MSSYPTVQYNKAVISGWAIPPSLLKGQQRIEDPALQLIDPLEVIAPILGRGTAVSKRPLDRWLEAAPMLFAGSSAEPRIYDTVIGYSLGGMLALAAVDAGMLVTRQLILVSSTLRFVGEPAIDPESELPLWPGAEPGAVRNLRRRIGQEREAALSAFYSTVIGVNTPDPGRCGQLLEHSSNYSEAALAWGLDLLDSLDLRARAPELKLPVMIIHGTEDEVIPAAAAARGSHILPNTTPLFVNGAGHDLFYAAPDLLGSLLFSQLAAAV